MLPYGCDWPSHCPAQRLFDGYIQHAQKIGTKRRAIETQLGVFLNRAVPGLRKVPGTFKTGSYSEEGSVYQFPTLAVCRNHFAAMLHQEVEWDQPSEWLSKNGGQDDDIPF
jgi:hypothetical protein